MDYEENYYDQYQGKDSNLAQRIAILESLLSTRTCRTESGYSDPYLQLRNSYSECSCDSTNPPSVQDCIVPRVFSETYENPVRDVQKSPSRSQSTPPICSFFNKLMDNAKSILSMKRSNSNNDNETVGDSVCDSEQLSPEEIKLDPKCFETARVFKECETIYKNVDPKSQVECRFANLLTPEDSGITGITESPMVFQSHCSCSICQYTPNDAGDYTQTTCSQNTVQNVPRTFADSSDFPGVLSKNTMSEMPRSYNISPNVQNIYPLSDEGVNTGKSIQQFVDISTTCDDYVRMEAGTSPLISIFTEENNLYSVSPPSSLRGGGGCRAMATSRTSTPDSSPCKNTTVGTMSSKCPSSTASSIPSSSSKKCECKACPPVFSDYIASITPSFPCATNTTNYSKTSCSCSSPPFTTTSPKVISLEDTTQPPVDQKTAAIPQPPCQECRLLTADAAISSRPETIQQQTMTQPQRNSILVQCSNQEVGKRYMGTNVPSEIMTTPTGTETNNTESSVKYPVSSNGPESCNATKSYVSDPPSIAPQKVFKEDVYSFPGGKRGNFHPIASNAAPPTCYCTPQRPTRTPLDGKYSFLRSPGFTPTQDQKKSCDDLQFVTDKQKDIKSQMASIKKRSATYTGDLNNYEQLLQQGGADFDKISKDLKMENMLLRNELQDLKLELKQCIERVQGPMQHKLLEEQCKCLKLEEQLNQTRQQMENKERNNMEKILDLKKELTCTCNNVEELTGVNQNLQQELECLNTLCEKLEDDLIKQKMLEAETITLLSKKIGSQNGKPCNCKSEDFICEENLHVIARKLSETLRQSDPCAECANLPPDFKSAVVKIKELTDLVGRQKVEFGEDGSFDDIPTKCRCSRSRKRKESKHRKKHSSCQCQEAGIQTGKEDQSKGDVMELKTVKEEVVEEEAIKEDFVKETAVAEVADTLPVEDIKEEVVVLDVKLDVEEEKEKLVPEATEVIKETQEDIKPAQENTDEKQLVTAEEETQIEKPKEELPQQLETVIEEETPKIEPTEEPKVAEVEIPAKKSDEGDEKEQEQEMPKKKSDEGDDKDKDEIPKEEVVKKRSKDMDDELICECNIDPKTGRKRPSKKDKKKKKKRDDDDGEDIDEEKPRKDRKKGKSKGEDDDKEDEERPRTERKKGKSKEDDDDGEDVDEESPRKDRKKGKRKEDDDDGEDVDEEKPRKERKKRKSKGDDDDNGKEDVDEERPRKDKKKGKSGKSKEEDDDDDDDKDEGGTGKTKRRRIKDDDDDIKGDKRSKRKGKEEEDDDDNEQDPPGKRSRKQDTVEDEDEYPFRKNRKTKDQASGRDAKRKKRESKDGDNDDGDQDGKKPSKRTDKKTKPKDSDMKRVCSESCLVYEQENIPHPKPEDVEDCDRVCPAKPDPKTGKPIKKAKSKELPLGVFPPPPDFPFKVDTKIEPIRRNPPSNLHVTTTVTDSGTLEVVTEGPTGIIETSMVYTTSGNVEVVTELLERDSMASGSAGEQGGDFGPCTCETPSKGKMGKGGKSQMSEKPSSLGKGEMATVGSKTKGKDVFSAEGFDEDRIVGAEELDVDVSGRVRKPDDNDDDEKSGKRPDKKRDDKEKIVEDKGTKKGIKTDDDGREEDDGDVGRKPKKGEIEAVENVKEGIKAEKYRDDAKKGTTEDEEDIQEGIKAEKDRIDAKKGDTEGDEDVKEGIKAGKDRDESRKGDTEDIEDIGEGIKTEKDRDEEGGIDIKSKIKKQDDQTTQKPSEDGVGEDVKVEKDVEEEDKKIKIKELDDEMTQKPSEGDRTIPAIDEVAQTKPYGEDGITQIPSTRPDKVKSEAEDKSSEEIQSTFLDEGPEKGGKDLVCPIEVCPDDRNVKKVVPCGVECKEKKLKKGKDSDEDVEGGVRKPKTGEDYDEDVEGGKKRQKTEDYAADEEAGKKGQKTEDYEEDEEDEEGGKTRQKTEDYDADEEGGKKRQKTEDYEEDEEEGKKKPKTEDYGEDVEEDKKKPKIEDYEEDAKDKIKKERTSESEVGEEGEMTFSVQEKGLADNESAMKQSEKEILKEEKSSLDKDEDEDEKKPRIKDEVSSIKKEPLEVEMEENLLKEEKSLSEKEMMSHVMDEAPLTDEEWYTGEDGKRYLRKREDQEPRIKDEDVKPYYNEDIIPTIESRIKGEKEEEIKKESTVKEEGPVLSYVAFDYKEPDYKDTVPISGEDRGVQHPSHATMQPEKDVQYPSSQIQPVDKQTSSDLESPVKDNMKNVGVQFPSREMFAVEIGVQVPSEPIITTGDVPGKHSDSIPETESTEGTATATSDMTQEPSGTVDMPVEESHEIGMEMLDGVQPISTIEMGSGPSDVMKFVDSEKLTEEEKAILEARLKEEMLSAVLRTDESGEVTSLSQIPPDLSSHMSEMERDKTYVPPQPDLIPAGDMSWTTTEEEETKTCAAGDDQTIVEMKDEMAEKCQLLDSSCQASGFADQSNQCCECRHVGVSTLPVTENATEMTQRCDDSEELAKLLKCANVTSKLEGNTICQAETNKKRLDDESSEELDKSELKDILKEIAQDIKALGQPGSKCSNIKLIKECLCKHPKLISELREEKIKKCKGSHKRSNSKCRCKVPKASKSQTPNKNSKIEIDRRRTCSVPEQCKQKKAAEKAQQKLECSLLDVKELRMEQAPECSAAHPPECDCLECICAPCYDPKLLNEVLKESKSKISARKKPSKCLALKEKRTYSEIHGQKKEHTSSCTCLDCLCLPTVRKLAMTKEYPVPKKNQVYQVLTVSCSCTKKGSKIPVSKSGSNPPGSSKPCDCRVCKCNPCKDPNRKAGAAEVCDCDPCECEDCKTSKAPGANADKVCSCGPCDCKPSCPIKEKLAAERKDKTHPKSCTCLQCLCEECLNLILPEDGKPSAPIELNDKGFPADCDCVGECLCPRALPVVHPLDCDCLDCACARINEYRKIAAGVHPADCDCLMCTCPALEEFQKKHAATCDCPECLCSPCAYGGGKTNMGCSCSVCSCDNCTVLGKSSPKKVEGCNCRDCKCTPKQMCQGGKGIDASKSEKEITPCDCEQCKCDDCPDTTKAKCCDCQPVCECEDCEDPNVKRQDCVCEICKCGQEKDCDCDVCKCEEPPPDSVCSCEVCKCADSEASPCGTPGCNCPICDCLKNILAAKADVITDDESKCTCTLCACLPGGETTQVDIQTHGMDCPCDACVCDKTKQDKSVCDCAQCVCLPRSECFRKGADSGDRVVHGDDLLKKSKDTLDMSQVPEIFKECDCKQCQCERSKGAGGGEGATNTGGGGGPCPNCGCTECVCHGSEEKSGCICGTCKCNPCISRGGDDTGTTIKSSGPCPNCTCDPCKCGQKPEITQKGPCPNCGCDTCKCEQKTAGPCPDCKCADCKCQKQSQPVGTCSCIVCQCDACQGGGQNQSKSQSGPCPNCTCSPCQCNKEGGGATATDVCKCSPCKCDPCVFKKQGQGGGAGTCSCIVCQCDNCQSGGGGKDSAKKSEHGSCPNCNCTPCKCLANTAGAGGGGGPCPNCTCDSCKCQLSEPAKTVEKSAGPCPNCNCTPCKCQAGTGGGGGGGKGPCPNCTCDSCKCQLSEPAKTVEKTTGPCPNCNCTPCKCQGGAASAPSGDGFQPKCWCTNCKCENCIAKSGQSTTTTAKETQCTCVQCKCVDCVYKKSYSPQKNDGQPPPFEVPVRKNCECQRCDCVICTEKGKGDNHNKTSKCDDKKTDNKDSAPLFVVPVRKPCTCLKCDCAICENLKDKPSAAMDLKNCDTNTLRNKIAADKQETCQCRQEIEEIRKALDSIRCACTEAEAFQTKPFVKQASSFGDTMCGLKEALKNLEEKCKAKDRMIDAMTGELKSRGGDLDNVLKNKNGCNEIPDYDKTKDTSSKTSSKHKEKRKSRRTAEKVDVSGFEIIDIRRITNDSLIIKWNPPCSTKIIGYDIFVNGTLKSKVMSGDRTSAMIHSLDLSATIQITIYAVTKCGRSDPPAIAIYEICK